MGISNFLKERNHPLYKDIGQGIVYMQELKTHALLDKVSALQELFKKRISKATNHDHKDFYTAYLLPRHKIYVQYFFCCHGSKIMAMTFGVLGIRPLSCIIQIPADEKFLRTLLY